MKWISVRERLPLDRVQVLIAYDFAESPIVGYYLSKHHEWYGSTETAELMRLDIKWGKLELQEFITHWMPLPAMPKY